MNCKNCNNKTNNPKFCSRSCGISYNNRIKPKRIQKKKTCEFCHKEYPARFKNKKYCSRECHTNFKIYQIHTTGKFTASWNNSRSIRNYLIKTSGNFCSLCNQSGENWNGKPITLIVDHIDGKADNWNITNIRLVCPNCDSQLPTFKGRNVGNSTRKFTIVQK